MSNWRFWKWFQFFSRTSGRREDRMVPKASWTWASLTRRSSCFRYTSIFSSSRCPRKKLKTFPEPSLPHLQFTFNTISRPIKSIPPPPFNFTNFSTKSFKIAIWHENRQIWPTWKLISEVLLLLPSISRIFRLKASKLQFD